MPQSTVGRALLMRTTAVSSGNGTGTPRPPVSRKGCLFHDLGWRRLDFKSLLARSVCHRRVSLQLFKYAVVFRFRIDLGASPTS